MSQSNPYTEAVTSGKYDRGKTYFSKYDHVRLSWEDAVTRRYMKPAIAGRLKACKEAQRGLRILDLGCGSGDGFEMFMHIPGEDNDLQSEPRSLYTYEDIDHYTGVDLTEDLLKQNDTRWGNDPKMTFCQGDLSKGLSDIRDHKPYDIYFLGYGTLSHFTREQTINLLSDIVRHAENGAVVIGDWLGRFSYEWMDLWNDDLTSEQWMDYYISYIYPPEERKKVSLSVLNLRLVTDTELKANVIDPVNQQSDAQLSCHGFYDRSIFIGRHMDTGDYNPHTPHLRQWVNSLFERGQRTPLQNLVIEFSPHSTLERENEFFRNAFSLWNYVVSQCAELIYGKKNPAPTSFSTPPDFALQCVKRFKSIIDNLDVYFAEDVRADVLEVQLAFLLRDIEMYVQQGRGNGHGLVGIFDIVK